MATLLGVLAMAIVGIQQLAAQSHSSDGAQTIGSVVDPNVVREGTLGGLHHHLNLVSVGSGGRLFTLDSVVVETDRITILYHATGVKSISFAEVTQNPLYRTEPPTLVLVAVDGQVLTPIDAATEGPEGGTRWGYLVVRWAGGVPHHIHVSVKRVEGDQQATWEVDTDL